MSVLGCRRSPNKGKQRRSQSVRPLPRTLMIMRALPDQHYLTVEEAAQQLLVKSADVLALVSSGEITSLCTSSAEVRIPRVAVDAHMLRVSSRALLVLRTASEHPQRHAPSQRRTLSQRYKDFSRRSEYSPEDYLSVFASGKMNLLDDDTAPLAVEAEEIVDARRRAR